MLTINDFDNVAAYILNQKGPMMPMELRQLLDRIARGAGVLVPRDEPIDPECYPPMRRISDSLEVWTKNNQESGNVVHLITFGNTQELNNQERQRNWEDNHPGQGIVILHELAVGNPHELSEDQINEVERFSRIEG